MTYEKAMCLTNFASMVSGDYIRHFSRTSKDDINRSIPSSAYHSSMRYKNIVTEFIFHHGLAFTWPILGISLTGSSDIGPEGLKLEDWSVKVLNTRF